MADDTRLEREVLELDTRLSGEATRVYRIAQVELSDKERATFEHFQETMNRLKQLESRAESK